MVFHFFCQRAMWGSVMTGELVPFPFNLGGGEGGGHQENF